MLKLGKWQIFRGIVKYFWQKKNALSNASCLSLFSGICIDLPPKTLKKQKANDIPVYKLDNQYLFVHKEGLVDSDFGMDNTNELIEGGFGLY
jgi:hypothetical protein